MVREQTGESEHCALAYSSSCTSNYLLHKTYLALGWGLKNPQTFKLMKLLMHSSNKFLYLGKVSQDSGAD